ncbi:hypothetical protein [Trichococcus collinsii]|uniref:Uncharacterized protein n=1 Tax=Trichococcus collinsii TaxID=157076 RepID=A0AB38A2U4_9LACT|nr:hypothetical protein [Trichococcus collinsii]CZR00725.1 galactose oxidase/kelch beta-propeller [Trichococcus collinsii]SEA82901.1 hypothetical protein SAMN04488525_10727 [Trichococcus collinsii]
MRKQTILLLSFLLLVVLGGFYAQPLFAKDEPLKMDIRTILGDDALLEGLTYYGTASNQQEATTFSLDRSGLRPSETQQQDVFFQDYADSAVRAWRTDYRSFMRGKSSYSGNYADTEDHLYYVVEENDGFSLEILDKANGTVSESLLAYPEKKHKTYYSVSRTFYLDGKVILEYSRYGNYSDYLSSDIVIYDPISGSLEEHFVFEMPEAVSGYQSISTDILTQDTQKAIFVALRTEETDLEATAYVSPIISIAFKRYDWDTKQWTDLANTQDFSKDNLPYAIEDGIFYQLNPSGGNCTIQSLDLMQDKVLETIALETAGNWEFTSASDWKILIAGNNAVLTQTYIEPDRAAQLAVFDIGTGEMLYSGEITALSGTNKETDSLYFDRIVYEP